MDGVQAMSYHQGLTFQKIKRRFFKYWPVIWKLTGFFVLAFFLLSAYYFLWPLARSAKEILKNPLDFWSFILPQAGLKGTANRTNLLILGTGGNGHEGPDLSDTIIFISLNRKKEDKQSLLLRNKVVLLSVPRDIWLESLEGKINTAYALGERKRKGGGLILAKSAVSEILDQPVHYAVRINFAGFKKTVDLVGGVDIEVENALDDERFPAEGKENDPCNNDPELKCRFEHLVITSGRQHMDGTLALKYVRSRYAKGEEGTDFARVRRQQKLILALKDKIISRETLFNPEKVKDLIKTFGENIDTDISFSEIDDFFKLFGQIKKESVKTLILDSEFLYNPPVNEANDSWILLPKGDDWNRIRQYVKESLE